jgi:tRNA dimethylallyltransferase
VSRVVAVFGPTASGKTAVARAIAARTPAELISADSMQVYRGLPILTNQSGGDTRLVGIWPLAHEASVVAYARLAHEAVDGALAAGRLAVVVGGTGLYLRAALAELDVPPAPEPGARARLGHLYDEEGAEAAHALLAERDPGAAAVVHPNDRRRARARAGGGGQLAPSGARPALDGRHPAPDARRRPRGARGRARAPHRGAHTRDVRRRGRGGGAPGARR